MCANYSTIANTSAASLFTLITLTTKAASAHLSEAVDAAVVFDLLTARHHHSSLNCVDRIGSLERRVDVVID